MKALFLLIFIISTLSYGKVSQKESFQCQLPELVPRYDNFSKIYNDFVNRDICNEGIIEAAAFEDYKKHKPNTAQKNEVILGKNLKATSMELIALKKAIEHLSDSEKENVKIRISNCHDVVCALRSLYENQEAAYLALSFYFKTKAIPSVANHKGEFHRWSVKELRDLNYFVDEIPKKFRELPTLGYIFSLSNDSFIQEATKEIAYSQPSLNKEGSIILSHTFQTVHDPKVRKKAFFHQLAHHYDFAHYLKKGKLFSVDSGYADEVGFSYIRSDNELKYRRRDGENKEKQCFLSSSARLNSFEDFAASVTVYMTEPDRFKQQCPDKYDYLKVSVFEGKEFYKNYEDVYEQVQNHLSSNQERFNSCLVAVNSQIDSNMSMQYKIDYHYSRKLYTELSETQRKLLDQGYEYGYSAPCLREIVSDILLQDKFKMTDVCLEGIHHQIERFANHEINERAKPQVDEAIKLAIKNIPEFSNECLESKDLTSSCIRQKIALSLARVGYNVKNIFTDFKFNHSAKNYDFEKANINIAELMLSCIDQTKAPVESMFQKSANIVNTCGEIATEYLKQNGYALNDRWFVYSSNLFQTPKVDQFLVTLSNEFINKSMNDYIEACPSLEESCLKEQLKVKATTLASDLQMTEEMVNETFVDYLYFKLKEPKRFIASEVEEE
jgi:hypothetical protein